MVLLGLNIAAMIIDGSASSIHLNPPLDFVYPFTVIMLCRQILKLRSYSPSSDSARVTNGWQMMSVNFANIGGSISFTTDGEDEDILIDATLDEIVYNPLAIGMVEDIRRRANRQVWRTTEMLTPCMVSSCL